MKSQKKQIHKKNWDILIVLDACRYDVFKDTYNEYLSGELEKVKSAGSNTLEWLTKTFEDYYSFIYVSGNPYVNSKGVSFGEWKATDHFSEIKDTWLNKWNDKKNTVMPESMNELILNTDSREKRLIAHYMQPHTPYISLDKSLGWENRYRALEKEKGKFASLRENLFDFLVHLFGEARARNLVNFVKGEKPGGDFEKNWIWEYGARRIIKAYEENLQLALDSISNLISEINGKVVITSDHGESFGENGFWQHACGLNIPCLVEVPWLEVEK